MIFQNLNIVVKIMRIIIVTATGIETAHQQEHDTRNYNSDDTKDHRYINVASQANRIGISSFDNCPEITSGSYQNDSRHSDSNGTIIKASLAKKQHEDFPCRDAKPETYNCALDWRYRRINFVRRN